MVMQRLFLHESPGKNVKRDARHYLISHRIFRYCTWHMHTTSDIGIDMLSVGAHVVLSTGDEIIKESSCGAVVRALACHQCGGFDSQTRRHM